ncbi:MAG: stage III sporulation protein AE [Suilimivivens sp.]
MDTYIFEQMNQYDLDEIEKGFLNLFPDYSIDIEELFLLIMDGKIGNAAGLFFSSVMEGMRGEISGIRTVLISILVIGIVSALFSNFSDIFAGGQVSQTGFYFLYLFLMAVLTRVFVYISEIATETIENVVLLIKLFIPTWFLSVGAASGGATAAFYYQMMLLAAYFIESFLISAVIPFVYSYVILALLNGIWTEERLSLLLDFLKKGVEFILKLIMSIIAGLSLVQAVIVPVVDELRISAFRKALLAIPGIGTAAEGVTELVIGSAVLIKNSMGVLLLVLLLLSCLVPLLKILTVAGLVKLGAAVTGIISDKRISGCADRVGEGCFLMLRCVFTAAALFVIVVAIVAYAVR